MTPQAKRIDLSRSKIGDRHQSRLRLVHTEAHRLPDWRLPDELPVRIHSPKREQLRRGVRVVELPGRLSARHGSFQRWQWHRQAREYRPLIRWDSGVVSFSSLDILELEMVQLCLRLR